MTTAELIANLKSLDPEGTTEITVDGAAIYFCEYLPAYYDGCLIKLDQDKNNPHYNITGATLQRHGFKVRIHTLSLEDVIEEDPNIPIKFEMEQEAEKHYKEHIDSLRIKHKKVI